MSCWENKTNFGNVNYSFSRIIILSKVFNQKVFSGTGLVGKKGESLINSSAAFRLVVLLVHSSPGFSSVVAHTG